MRGRATRAALVAAGYLAAMVFWIYGIVNPSIGYASDSANVVFGGALIALHIATGWLAKRWWAVLLPAVPVVLAIPAGNPAEGYEPFPIWFGLAIFAAPVGAAIIALSVLVARLRERGLRPS